MNSSRQKRSRRRRCNTGVLAADISREQLEQWFHLPSHQACARLGISLSVLKRVCRKQGIPRWPYRAVGSTAWPSKDPSSSSSPPPETFETELTTSSSDHCGLAPMLPTSSSVPSSPGQGAKHSKHSAHGAEAQHASSSPPQPQREAKVEVAQGGLDAAAPEGLDALLAAVAAVEPASQPAPAAAVAGKHVPAASGAGIKAEPAWGSAAWLAAAPEGVHGEDWGCSCRAGGAAGQVPHQPCSSCPPLPSLGGGWPGLDFAGLAGRAGERALDPPSPQQHAERPQQAQHQESVLAALEYSVRQHQQHAAVDALDSGHASQLQGWPSAALLGWQQPAGRAGLGPSVLGGIDSASGTFPPSWLHPQHQQQLAAAEQRLRSRQHFLTGALGSQQPQQQRPTQPQAPTSTHGTFQPLQELQLQALMQQRQSQGELSLVPQRGIAASEPAGSFSRGSARQPSIPRLAFTSSSYPAATEPASWQQQHQSFHLVATLTPAAQLAQQQQGVVGEWPASSHPWDAAPTAVLHAALARAGTLAAPAGGAVGAAPSPLVEGLLPQASALMSLLESGLGMMRSQPDHPLAAQLAAAMKEAVEAITLGANHMQG